MIILVNEMRTILSYSVRVQILTAILVTFSEVSKGALELEWSLTSLVFFLISRVEYLLFSLSTCNKLKKLATLTGPMILQDLAH